MNDVIHSLQYILVFGFLFVVVILLEAYYLHRKGDGETYSLKETLTNMTMGASYKITDGIAVALVIRVFYDYVYQFGLQYEPQHGVFSIILIFFLADLAFFVMHFATHKVRLFWTSHVTHHSSHRMNYSTALRQNFTIFFNGSWMIWWVPIALVGFDKNWATIAIELNLAYQFFLHTETTSPLDKLGTVLNTPSHHRVHHGSNPGQIDTNFGGVLIIWDKLFGTFQPEEQAGPIKYGITYRQPESLNPIYLQLHEWIDMAKDLWKYKDLRAVFSSPGWVENNCETKIRHRLESVASRQV